MIFEELIKDNKEEFLKAVNDTATFLGVKPEWLMFVMWFETAHTLNPHIQNGITKATGLIQFMPSTAKALGTSIDELMKMTNVEQMTYVKKYLSPAKGKCRSFVDLYCQIFWPKAVGKPDTFVITQDIVAKQNPIFDQNKDGDIAKYEIRKVLLNQIPVKYKPLFTA